MGNCMLKSPHPSTLHPHHHHAVDHDDHEMMMIKVVTTNGAIMELYAPVTAGQITSEFPGHGLYRSSDPDHSNPLLPKFTLRPGHLYYLLRLSDAKITSPSAAPYRISVDDPRLEVKGSHPDRNRGNKGVWKVRLVINPEQLSEILAQDSRTEELIESVRAVAKCGGAATSTAAKGECSSKSDESSVSSSCSFHWRAYVKQTTQSKCPIDSCKV